MTSWMFWHLVAKQTPSSSKAFWKLSSDIVPRTSICSISVDSCSNLLSTHKYEYVNIFEWSLMWGYLLRTIVNACRAWSLISLKFSPSSDMSVRMKGFCLVTGSYVYQSFIMPQTYWCWDRVFSLVVNPCQCWQPDWHLSDCHPLSVVTAVQVDSRHDDSLGWSEK